jgi:uncharacterized Zn finger protein (UPF0148 family)
MSDFDKEAEREKLREKYGEDDEKRKATEQMSELLLKGATMTNAHCTDCGDPIFRYDGQEFCPTCQKPVARDQSVDEDGETGDDHIEVADPSDDATVQFGDGQAGADTAADGQDTATGTTDEAPANGAADASATDGPDMAADAAGRPPAAEGEMGDTTREIPSADPDRSPDPVSTPERDAPAPTADRPTSNQRGSTRRSGENPVTAELSAAESLLAETVHRFAQRAADTDDPRAAREHLKAAREAAEALDAVRF